MVVTRPRVQRIIVAQLAAFVLLFAAWGAASASPRAMDQPMVAGEVAMTPGPRTSAAKFTVTMRYVDQFGAQIHESDSDIGYVGDAYYASPRVIDDYVMAVSPANVFGDLSADVTLTFVYVADGNLPVTTAPREPVAVPGGTGSPVRFTVRHRDQFGTDLGAPMVVLGYAGDSFSARPRIIEGYRVTVLPGPGDNGGTLTSDRILTFTYVNEELVPVSATPREPVAPEGRVGEPVRLTVRYRDQFGTDLREPDRILAYPGDQYFSDGIRVDGYDQVIFPANQYGTITENAIVTHVFSSSKNIPVGTTTREPTAAEEGVGTPVRLMIRYQDQYGDELGAPTVLLGYSGDYYRAAPKLIDGYEPVISPRKTFAKHSTGTILTFIYTSTEKLPVGTTPREPVAAEGGTGTPVRLTIRHTNRSGDELAAPDVALGYVGDRYTASPKVISGYEVTGFEGPIWQRLEAGGAVVTFVYEAMGNPAPTPSVTPSASASPSPSVSSSGTPSPLASPTTTASPSSSASPSASASPSTSASPSPSATPSRTIMPSPKVTPSLACPACTPIPVWSAAGTTQPSIPAATMAQGDRALAQTGADAAGWIVGGAALICAGIAAVLLGRRRAE